MTDFGALKMVNSILYTSFLMQLEHKFTYNTFLKESAELRHRVHLTQALSNLPLPLMRTTKWK